MSPGFTGTLSGQLIEPSQVSYNAIALSTNLTLAWPNLSTTGSFTANIIEVTPSAGSLSITMPDATQRSVGQQVLFRNMTGTAFTVKDNSGGTIASIAANTAIFIYLVTNATAAGSWSLVTFGTGTSSADSATLAGAGLKAIGITLNQKHDVLETTSNVTIDSTYRAQTVVWTSGSLTCTLPTASSMGADFFFIAKNGGAGSITFTPSGADTIDGAASLVLAPNDAAMFFSSGSSAHWYTVGVGHSVTFAFTQLVKNVAGSADVTLTSAECANKVMKFTGLLTGNINVIVTSTVSVYYLFNNTSGAFTLTVKTAAGTGYAILQGSRDIVTCDATNVDRSVSNTAATTIFPVGSAASPSVTFTARTDTGLYSPGVGQAGIAAGGLGAAIFTTTGINSAAIGATTPSTGAFTTGSFTGQVTSTVVTGTAPLVVASTTAVANLTASNVTTNANLTGPITSAGNATSVAAQTGTGSIFAMQASPALTTPNIGAATGSSLSVTGQLTSTVATGTAPLVVSSTTQVANLNAATAGTVTTNANLTGPVTSTGNATSIASGNTYATPTLTGTVTVTGTTISGAPTWSNTQTLNTSGNAATVTTNANLTGPITSAGNATSIAAQTGTGTTFVMQAGSPNFTGTPTVVGFNIGYLEAPINQQDTNYTLVLSDSGKTIYHTSGSAHTHTIPANASVAYPTGTILTFVNDNAAGIVSIAITTDTLRLIPAGTTGTRSLAANGRATAIKMTATTWQIAGTNLT